MNRILKFVRTTLVGGILFLLPLVVVVIIVGKALAIAGKIVTPLAARLPFESAIGLDTPKILAITLLVVFCFLAGVLARSALAQKVILCLETTVLSNVPGYEFFKGLSGNLLGDEKQQVHPVVLARASKTPGKSPCSSNAWKAVTWRCLFPACPARNPAPCIS